MSNIHTQWQTLLKKDMSRKQFLGLVGFVALAVLNIEPMLHLFSKSSHPGSSTAKPKGVNA